MQPKTVLLTAYDCLLDAYGPQGWWPLLDCQGSNPAKTGVVRGYHPGDYSYPRNQTERFEIWVGAILTQNTAWTNVERALTNLRHNELLEPRAMLACDQDVLRNAVRPSGYYRAKARKLVAAATAFSRLRGRCPTRESLLSVWGVGPETADSIRLYAYHRPEFVVDAYTRRIFSHLKLVTGELGYEPLKRWITARLEPDAIVFQEFHALLVEHAKRCYNKKPYQDTLLNEIALT